MVYCQACGAGNTPDAKFCNMCGGSIAAAGAPGGRLPPASRNSGSTQITLSRFGVQSPGRTRAILGGGAIVCALAGVGLGGWFARPEAPVSAAAPEEGPPPPVEIGDAIPVGADVPNEGVVISGGPRLRSTPRTRPGAGTPTTTTTTGSAGGARTAVPGSSGGGSNGSASSASGSTRASSSTQRPASVTGQAPAAVTTDERGAATPEGDGRREPNGSAAMGDPAAEARRAAAGGQAGTAPSPSGSTRDWGALAGTVGEEEPDFAMEHYSVQVRRYIRNYYAIRAASCFDHASRATGETVRGAVVIAFTIQGTGQVEGTSVSRNTTGREDLGQCLQRNVASWRLPAPPEGQPLEMEMPFSR